jgi:hypothetical protein
MDCLTLEYGTDCPETSVGNCYSSLRKIQIECICYGKSLLKSLPLLRGDVLLWECKPEEGDRPCPRCLAS